MNSVRRPILVILALITCSVVLAQSNGTMPDIKERPQAAAIQLTVEPVIDGEVINDELWQQFPAFDGLKQIRPYSGQPASEKTEIRIGYTETMLYVAVVCYDSQPDKLVVSDARRDASLDGTDSFLFIIDTYHDRQNGFVFGTNSLGVEYDGQVDNEGQGNFNNNRQQGGTIGGFNLNWDASWVVKSKVGDYGWSAEFAIPLRTIRFASGKDMVWGLNIQRNIRKTNEVAYWAPLPIQFDLKRLSLAGELTGLNLKSPGNLKLIPYVLNNTAKDFSKDPSKVKNTPDVGADIKYSITPSLTLDLTYNTDFAQVEVDQQQINLDRFNLFFPEKRPFFLENAGFFTVGSPGEVDLFFSRKIGIAETGQIVPIIGGARVSGRVNKTNVGVLSMFTDDVDVNDSVKIQKNNFNVARVNQQVGQRSTIGGTFVSREGGGAENDYNRVFAMDGKIGIGKKAQISGFFARSNSPDSIDDGNSFKLQSQYQWNGLDMNLAYTQVDEGFDPQAGFLFRKAFRKPEFLILKTIRMNGKMGGMLEIRPHVSYRGFWDFEGFQETGFLHVDNHWVWKNGFEIHTGINFTEEGSLTDFKIPGLGVVLPAGSFTNQEAQIVVITNPSKKFYISTRHVMGGYFLGSRSAHSGTIGFRIGDRFNSDYTFNHNDIHLMERNFATDVFGARLSYSFTPRMTLQSFFQYNSAADIVSANIRFNLLEQANTGLFVVYNEIWDGGSVLNRSFTIKYTHIINVLK
ncbi:MAG TPA: hydrolase [Cytophagales bacterium]|nr:hydrolase [Cytophagales bacterium]